MSSAQSPVTTPAPQPGDAAARSPLAPAVRRTLERLVQGPEARSVVAWLRDTLQMSHTVAWRKLAGQAYFTDEDLARVAARLRMPLSQFLMELALSDGEHRSATVPVAGNELPASVWLGERVRPVRGTCVAVQREGAWRVVDGHEARTDEAAYRVLSVVTQPGPARPRIALLDDDTNVTSLAADLLAELGFDADCFATAAQMRQGLAVRHYDALVVDWFLAGGETSEALIREVRESGSGPQGEAGRAVPIFIITGQLATRGEQAISALGEIVARYHCKPREKPVRWGLLAAELNTELKSAQPRERS